MKDCIVDVSPLEYYTYLRIMDYQQKEEDKTEKNSGDSGILFQENCAICMTPLYRKLFIEEPIEGSKQTKLKFKRKLNQIKDFCYLIIYDAKQRTYVSLIKEVLRLLDSNLSSKI